MKVFIDSNIIIETFKENYNKTAKDMLSFILKNISHNKIEAFINEVIESEVIYKFSV
jgi:predicted nucleic acid-binding protein